MKSHIPQAQSPLPARRPSAILFDWDNTLADSWPTIFEALSQTFVHMGREPWSFEDVKGGREGIHHSLRDSFPRLFGARWEEAREVYYKHFLEAHLEKIEPLAGAENVLKRLKKSDVFIAVVSNKTGKYLREEIEHLGWTHYFHAIVGANDTDKDKPHAEPLLFALKDSGIPMDENVWMIGDSVTDIEAALNASCSPHLYGDLQLPDHLAGDKRLKSPLPRYADHKELHATLHAIL